MMTWHDSSIVTPSCLLENSQSLCFLLHVSGFYRIIASWCPWHCSEKPKSVGSTHDNSSVCRQQMMRGPQGCVSDGTHWEPGSGPERLDISETRGDSNWQPWEMCEVIYRRLLGGGLARGLAGRLVSGAGRRLHGGGSCSNALHQQALLLALLPLRPQAQALRSTSLLSSAPSCRDCHFSFDFSFRGECLHASARCWVSFRLHQCRGQP